MRRSRSARSFLKGRPYVVESYYALWHLRDVFAEKYDVRIDRYRKRCEIEGRILCQGHSGWRPAKSYTRLVEPSEFEVFREMLE